MRLSWIVIALLAYQLGRVGAPPRIVVTPVVMVKPVVVRVRRPCTLDERMREVLPPGCDASIPAPAPEPAFEPCIWTLNSKPDPDPCRGNPLRWPRHP